MTTPPQPDKMRTIDGVAETDPTTGFLYLRPTSDALWEILNASPEMHGEVLAYEPESARQVRKFLTDSSFNIQWR